MRPKISIIVPVYNSGKCVARLIDSILNQSYNDFELILVDDCSKDNSRDICRQYAEKDKRIKLICSDKNSGVSVARNKALDAAMGDYVMFADSDDAVASDWCKSLYDAVQEHPDDLVSSNIFIRNDDSCLLKVPTGKSSRKLTGYYELFSMGISGYPVNKIFSLQILNENNIRFSADLYMGEDVEFVIKYINCLRGGFYYLDAPLYFYYTNSQSITHTWHEDDLVSHLRLFAYRLPLIDKKDMHTFCDTYFSHFIALFSNIFDKRCKKKFIYKMKYNQRAMKSEEFLFCLANMSGADESAAFLKVVRMRNYYLLWAFQKISSILELFRKSLHKK